MKNTFLLRNKLTAGKNGVRLERVWPVQETVPVLLCGLMLLTVLWAGPSSGIAMPGDQLYMAVGVVRSVGRNTIEILDERDGVLKRLLYFGASGTFQPGARVRAYYIPNDGRVSIIKKLTVLGYSKDSQNLGFTFKTP